MMKLCFHFWLLCECPLVMGFLEFIHDLALLATLFENVH